MSINKIYYILVVLICAVGFAETGIYTSFNTGEISPDLHGRIDALKYYSGCRILENFFVWAQGPVEKRRGTYFIGEVGGEIFPAVEAIPGAAATYKTTYISENGKIWGIPLNFSNYTTLNLDAGGIARDAGGGIVALPCLGHPFVEGQVIWIEGTSNYEQTHTLTSGTSDTELQFTDTFNAETFDGSETVVQRINMSAGAGRIDQDDEGNLYYGQSSANYVIKIETDDTIVTDFFTPDSGWPVSGSVFGVKVSNDNSYLYVCFEKPGTTNYHYLYKFNLSDGSEIWSLDDAVSGEYAGAFGGYGIDIDSDDNVYILAVSGGWPGGDNLSKFDAGDATKTDFDVMGEGKAGYVSGGCPYAVVVDNDMGIVIAGGRQYCSAGYDESVLYNLAVRDLSNTDGEQTALGGTYTDGGIDFTYTIGTDCIVTNEEYIYVIVPGNTTLYKLDSELNTITSITAPTYAVGIFVDLIGHIVIVNQDYTSGQDDIFWFYDTDLNYLSKTDGFYTSILKLWDYPVGGAWMQGNAVFDGHLGSADIPAVPAIEVFSNGDAEVPPARLISFEYSKGDSYVIEMGAGYFRFFVGE